MFQRPHSSRALKIPRWASPHPLQDTPHLRCINHTGYTPNRFVYGVRVRSSCTELVEVRCSRCSFVYARRRCRMTGEGPRILGTRRSGGIITTNQADIRSKLPEAWTRHRLPILFFIWRRWSVTARDARQIFPREQFKSSGIIGLKLFCSLD